MSDYFNRDNNMYIKINDCDMSTRKQIKDIFTESKLDYHTYSDAEEMFCEELAEDKLADYACKNNIPMAVTNTRNNIVELSDCLYIGEGILNNNTIDGIVKDFIANNKIDSKASTFDVNVDMAISILAEERDVDSAINILQQVKSKCL